MDNLYRHYLKSDYNDDYYSDDGNSGDPDVDNMYKHFLKSDNSDEYYSDDYTDTICYQPGLSTRKSRASGAFHHGISSQPWQCQPNSSSGKSLVKQDPQNRRYPKPRKARKRHKKKRLKPTPPSPTVTGVLCTQIKRRLSNPPHSPWRAPMNTKRGTTRDHLQH
jgi:hypothetical protein